MSFLVSSVTEGLLHLVVVTILLGPLIWWTSHRHGRPVLGRRGWLNLGLAGVL